MRWRAAPIIAGLLAACSSHSEGAGQLTLNDPYWDRVNVEIVITRSANCDNRGEGYISSRQFVMRKNRTQSIDVPDGASVCWRHDPNPNDPVAGAWSGWTRATLNPGASASTDL